MKALKKNVPEQKQLTSVILESANQIWLAGLGAFARAQEEGTKVFDTLVEAGKEIENTGKRVAEELTQTEQKPPSGTDDTLDKLRKLAEMKESGILTEEEFKQLKERLLAQI